MSICLCLIGILNEGCARTSTCAKDFILSLRCVCLLLWVV